jgi:hypothetical protein
MYIKAAALAPAAHQMSINKILCIAALRDAALAREH